MLLIAVYYRRYGRNLRAKLYTAINSLSANHAYLKTFYNSYQPTEFHHDSSTKFFSIFVHTYIHTEIERETDRQTDGNQLIGLLVRSNKWL